MDNRTEYLEERRRARKRYQNRRKKFIAQKFIGLAFIAMTIMVFKMASGYATFSGLDIAPTFITGPLGLFLLFTRHVVIT